MGHQVCLRVELFHQMAQEWVLLQPMTVNQALYLNKKGEINVFVIVPETGLALYQSARVRTLNGQFFLNSCMVIWCGKDVILLQLDS